MTPFMIRARRAPLANLSLALMLGFTTALPTTAWAGPTLETPTVPANSMQKVVIGIDRGCDGAATDRVSVALPDGLIAAQPMPKAGWSVATETASYDKAYDHSGTPMTEGVRRIVWSEGALPTAFYDEFTVRVRVTDLPEGTELPIRVTQGCGDAQVGWTEVAASGRDQNSLAHPAPLLTVGTAQASGAAPKLAAADVPSVMTHGPITLSNVFARATPGGAKVGAAYFKIRNTGDSPMALSTLRGDVAQRIELHSMELADGMMRMRPLDYILIPGGGTVSLKPGGDHVMMMGLSRPLIEGESFPLTLQFDTGLEINLTVPIGPVGAMSAHSHN
jgi:hypothetical protein